MYILLFTTIIYFRLSKFSRAKLIINSQVELPKPQTDIERELQLWYLSNENISYIVEAPENSCNLQYENNLSN